MTTDTTEDDTAGAKYFEIYVPDYDGSNNDSYVRLGVPYAKASDEPAVTDKDLWSQFTGFVDQDPTQRTRASSTNTDGNGPREWGYKDSPFGQAQDNFYAHLGWRDHSDGNRLTTTGGDKVEIIKGNYQLLVLGRQGDAGNGYAADASGGLFVDNDIAPGAITNITWVQDFSGTWKVTEETDKGDVHEIFHGEFKEEFLGSSMTSNIGQATAGTDDSANPDVFETTYAKKIESTTNASDHITETTSAPTITSTTNASTSITENVGDSNNKVPNINETIYATTITSSTHADTITETVGDAGKITEGSSTFWGNTHEYVMGSSTSIVLGGAFDLFLGAASEVFIGASLHIALAKELDLLIAAHTEVHLGRFHEITAGAKWDLVFGDEWEFAGNQKTITEQSKHVAFSIFIG